jgi:hypothetical protein
MNTVAFWRNTKLLGANKDDWADIASFELIAINHINDTFTNLFWAKWHVHLEDLGAVKQTFYVLWEAENGRSLWCFIGADTFKNAHSVV